MPVDNVVDGEVIEAAWGNDVADAINAIEALGSLATDAELAAHAAAGDPHTGYRLESVDVPLVDIADIATARLLGRTTAGSGNVQELTIQQALGLRRGTSFPGGPSSGDEFYRTDLNTLFFYDGSRWVTAQIYYAVSSMQSGTFPLSATTAPPWPRGELVVPSGYSDAYLLDVQTAFFVGSGASALSGSHKWVAVTTKQPAGSTVFTVSIDSGSSQVWRKDEQTLGALWTATNFIFETTITKTGTPGNLTMGYTVRYRLVAT